MAPSGWYRSAQTDMWQNQIETPQPAINQIISAKELLLSIQPIRQNHLSTLTLINLCDPFSRAPHRRWAMGCGRRTRRSLPSVHLFNAG
jgi:hypothetical protein